MDPFHIHREIMHKIGDKKKATKIHKCFNESRYEDVFLELEASYDSAQDEKDRVMKLKYVILLRKKT